MKKGVEPNFSRQAGLIHICRIAKFGSTPLLLGIILLAGGLASGEPVTGEVPADLLDEVYADLEIRTSADRSGFEIMRAEAVRWNDGSLGCPEPGMTYQHAPVDGYWIVIVSEGKQYDYRATDRGYFRICSGRTPPGRAAPTQ